MARVTHAVNVPVCTGENLYTRQGFRPLIEQQATSGVHIDIPKSGGLLEAKRISDLAEMYYIWTACHNPASPIGTIASCHAASAMRDFRIHELANWVEWWPDLVVHEGMPGHYLQIAHANRFAAPTIVRSSEPPLLDPASAQMKPLPGRGPAAISARYSGARNTS